MKDIGQAHNLRFKVVQDIDSDKVWLTEPYNIEDFYPIQYFIRLQYTGYWSEEWEREVGKYHVEFGVVSPQALNPDALKSLASNYDKSVEDFIRECTGDWLAIEAISAGHGVVFGQWSGNNIKKLLHSAHEEGKKACMLFGFYMDRAVNAIGTSGWDWARGEVLGGLNR